MPVFPKVSIVTPSFNQAQFLEQTIQSVLAQDYPNLEYIIVDGASQDGSLEIIQRYATRLAWWVSEPDQGQSEAVNKGWARATGEIIGWINSDDILIPGAVARIIRAFHEHPEMGVIYGDVLSIDAQGDIFNVMRFAQWGIEDLVCFNIISQPGAFLRREILERTGYLDLHLHYLMDTQLWLKMALLAPIHYLPGVVAAARYHPSAKNVSAGANYGMDAYRIIEWMNTQPGLIEIVKKNSSRIWSGAHRMSARYLLDADDARGALRDYFKSFCAYPPTALRETHRFLFALLSWIGLKRLKFRYYSWRLQRRRKRFPVLYTNISRYLSGEISSKT